VLTLSDQGELMLGISAGDSARSGSTNPTAAKSGSLSANYWRIDSLVVQVWAKAAEGSKEE
jgi:hypothetical protein